MSASMSRSQQHRKTMSQKRPETSAESSGPSDTDSTTPRLLDAVVASLPTTYHGIGLWIDSLPDAARVELEEIKRQYKAGLIQSPRRTLARAISSQLQDRGICRIGFSGVEAWLQRG